MLFNCSLFNCYLNGGEARNALLFKGNVRVTLNEKILSIIIYLRLLGRAGEEFIRLINAQGSFWLYLLDDKFPLRLFNCGRMIYKYKGNREFISLVVMINIELMMLLIIV